VLLRSLDAMHLAEKEAFKARCAAQAQEMNNRQAHERIVAANDAAQCDPERQAEQLRIEAEIIGVRQQPKPQSRRQCGSSKHVMISARAGVRSRRRAVPSFWPRPPDQVCGVLWCLASDSCFNRFVNPHLKLEPQHDCVEEAIMTMTVLEFEHEQAR
jgi:hypothetical protein